MISFVLVILILLSALGLTLYATDPKRKPVVYKHGVRDPWVVPVALIVSAAVGYGLGSAGMQFFAWVNR